MKAPPSVSIIIPVWNEAGNLPACLASIGDRGRDVQVIVVDAGSNDGSTTAAQAAGAEVVASPVRQRAGQMNLGAARATGDIVLFLHADTRLPPQWLPTLRAALAGDIVGGAFQRRFDSGSIVLRLTCKLADWRGRLCGWFLGDQAMFVRREIFNALGGFKDVPRCEDLDFSIRLSRTGRCCVLPATVHTSARRFQARGPLQQTLRDFVTAVCFAATNRARDRLEKRVPENR